MPAHRNWGRRKRRKHSELKVKHRVKHEPLAKVHCASRKHTIKVHGGKGVSVVLYVTSTRVRMYQICESLYPRIGRPDNASACILHRSLYRGPVRQQCLWPGRMLAAMFFNRQDLQYAPGELVAHESAHVGIALCRWLRLDPRCDPGEEVHAEAVGFLTQRLSNIWHRFYGLGAAMR